jgi:ribonuclease HII
LKPAVSVSQDVHDSGAKVKCFIVDPPRRIIEYNAMNDELLICCGIDEVGRGPLAGPVMAAAVILPRQLPSFFKDITDSKKLTTAKRESLFQPIMEYCQVGIGEASVQEIDQINILQATFLAMQRAYDALPVRPDKALVDGNRAPKLNCAVIETVIKGDTKIPAISAASIIAKVTRDRLMKQLCEEFPGYGWSSNAGYGSKAHMDGLTNLGPTIHHRRSFAPIRNLIELHS